MPNSMLIIVPRPSRPIYYSVDFIEQSGMGKYALIASLSAATLAAFAPNDFVVSIIDEHIDSVNYDHDAEIIALTGFVNHVERVREHARIFKERGKIVMIGGPHASLSPDSFRDVCDILVQGEIEDIAQEIFNDLRAGTWKDTYIGNRPDLRKSPVPRWDLYPNERTLGGAVQTSRGCPYECEFCDVIAYLGRKQRHKDPAQVIRELDVLYRHGYRQVFLSDDNLTVNRRHARELLTAVRDWNASRTDGPVEFSTQASIDLTDNDDLMLLCAEARVRNIFVGIETPSEESLLGAKKHQNVGGDLVKKLDRLTEYGIMVMGGMICGFDTDTTEIFEEQYQFAMKTSIPIFSLGVLVAPVATPLYDRMMKANRIEENVADSNVAAGFITNIRPTCMTLEQLHTGMHWLANRLYQPQAVLERVERFAANYGKALPEETMARLRTTKMHSTKTPLLLPRVIQKLSSMNPEISEFIQDIMTIIQGHPEIKLLITQALVQYFQVRYMYEIGAIWDPHIAMQTEPIHIDQIM